MIAVVSLGLVGVTRASKSDSSRIPSVVGYALVQPCSLCAERVGYTPLVAADSRNVALGSLRVGRAGVWCFRILGARDTRSLSVVASLEGGNTNETLPHTTTTISTVQWIEGAPDCMANELEIKTIVYSSGSNGLIAEPDRTVPFSFVVLG
jgi:hypothetical protein